jgi:hypothetical protein
VCEVEEGCYQILKWMQIRSGFPRAYFELKEDRLGYKELSGARHSLMISILQRAVLNDVIYLSIFQVLGL